MIMYVFLFNSIIKSKEFDTERIFLAKYLCFAPLDQDIERFEENLIINAVQICRSSLANHDPSLRN